MSKRLDRKAFLLVLLYAKGPTGKLAEPIVGRTRLAKLLFLLRNEQWGKDGLARIADDFYNFKPDDFGPFDINVYADLDFFRAIEFVEVHNLEPLPTEEASEYLTALKNWGISNETEQFIEERYWEQEFALTTSGHSFVESQIISKLANSKQIQAFEFVKQKYGAWPLKQLLRYIYSTYPEMTTKSKIKNAIMS